MMDALNIYQICYDKLIEKYSSGQFYEEVKIAKNEFINIWGEINDNDPHFDNRLQQFHDWYLYDRSLNTINQTPLEHYYSNHVLPEPNKLMINNMMKAKKSLFYIKKIKKGFIVLYDLINKNTYTLLHCDFMLIFEPKLIIDGRLILCEEGPILSNGFCLHPQGSSRYIKKKIRQILKAKVEENEKDNLLNDFIKKINSLYNQHIVYKHVDVSKIYSDKPLFSQPKKVFSEV